MPFAYALKVYCTPGTAFFATKAALAASLPSCRFPCPGIRGREIPEPPVQSIVDASPTRSSERGGIINRRKHESRIGGGRPASHLGVWNRRHRSQRCSGRCGSEVVDPGADCRASSVRTNLPPPAPRLHPAGRSGRQGRLPPLSPRLRAVVALTSSGRACPKARSCLIQHATSSERIDWVAWADPDSHAACGPRTCA
jgi:hypothetical protein